MRRRRISRSFGVFAPQDDGSIGVHVQNNDNAFFPRGAVAFFTALVIFYALFWAAMMALMVSRG